MKKPFLHALGAASYIFLIAFGVNITAGMKTQNGTFLVPMIMLSLFVLSAAVMGFLFLSEPFYLFMDNKKHEAIAFFGKTVGFFAGFLVLYTILFFIINF